MVASRSQDQPRLAGPRPPVAAFAALIALVCWAAYWNGLSGPFVYDDELAVAGNRSIREWWRVPDVFQAEQDTPTAGRPVVNFSFALNYAFAGLAVRPYHAVNLLVHVLCALVVFGLGRRTLELPSVPERLRRKSTVVAFAVALIWAVHPLNSEVIAYVSQRTESLMALFYLLTLYTAVRALRSRCPLAWQAAAVACCALGMACKESMATAPLMMVLYDRTFLFGSFSAALRQRWRFYGAVGGTWLLLAALMWSVPRGESAGFGSGVDPWTYLLNQAVMISQYLRLAFWPRSLVSNYGWPLPLALQDVFVPALLIAAMLAIACVAMIRSPKLGFAGGWFFITLAPASSLVPIATEVGAERRMYLPLIGLIALAVMTASSWWDRVQATRREPPRPARADGALLGLAVVVAALIAGTIARNREYASFVELARTVVARWPTSVAHHILGSALVAEGSYEEAIVHLRAALAGSPLAYYDLGVALFNQAKFAEAIEPLETMIRIRESPPATHPYWQSPIRGDVARARLLIGRALAEQQRWTEAAGQFEQSLAMAPSETETRKLLAIVLFRARSYDLAIPHFEAYLQSRPTDVDALNTLAISYVAAGKGAAAAEMLRRAVEVDPANGLTRRNLANALYDAGHLADAAVHAHEAVRLRPNDPDAHDLLGRVHGVHGRFAEAASEFERALEIDPAHQSAREHLETVRRYGRQ